MLIPLKNDYFAYTAPQTESYFRSVISKKSWSP